MQGSGKNFVSNVSWEPGRRRDQGLRWRMILKWNVELRDDLFKVVLNLVLNCLCANCRDCLSAICSTLLSLSGSVLSQGHVVPLLIIATVFQSG